MTREQLEEKIKSLTPKEVIMAMVNGLKKPYTDIVYMGTYGDFKNNVCYGCAATNAVCNINGGREDFMFDSDLSLGLDDRLGPIIADFERAVNALRMGCVRLCNDYLKLINIDNIKCDKITEKQLPDLRDDFKLEDLIPYEQLAEMQ